MANDFDESSANEEASKGLPWWYSADVLSRDKSDKTAKRIRRISITDRLLRHPGRLSMVYFGALIIIVTGLLLLPISTSDIIFTNFPVAFFTAVSALSTCGIPVVNTGEYWSMFGQVVVLFSIQFGGLGVMTFASMVALGVSRRLKVSQRMLTANELGTTKLSEVKGVLTVVLGTSIIAEVLTFVLLLPDLFRFEQVSQIGTGGDNAYMISGQPCTTPKFERKTLYDALTLIADKMGVKEQFTEGKTQEEWIKELYEKTREKDTELPTYDEAMEMGVYTRKNPKGATIAFEAFRNDPAANPLDTPTGKIEIYSETLAGIAATWELGEEDLISPIPVYTHGFTETDVPTDEFPLRCSGFHYRGRTHSSWGGIELLKEVNPQEAWINPADAKERSIKQGDKIRVKNAFGEIELLAKVTPRVVPGTVCISQGAWHDADMYGDRVDKGGCINTLTTHRPSPLAKGNPQHSNICQVTKA